MKMKMFSTVTATPLTDPYTSHEDIHDIDRSYIETVADKSIEELSLEEINDFIEGLAQYHFQEDVSIGTE
jgi:hypothetical protein